MNNKEVSIRLYDPLIPTVFTIVSAKLGDDKYLEIGSTRSGYGRLCEWMSDRIWLGVFGDRHQTGILRLVQTKEGR